jgi:protein ImuB
MTSPYNLQDFKKLSLPPRRWLHLWTPRLSIDRVKRAPHPPSDQRTSPLAIIAKRANTLRLEALDQAAEGLGLEVGLPLAAARSRVPELNVVEADPAADQALLEAIGEACRRYTPSLSLAPPDGINLDITGAAPLFGGEDALVDELSARMGRQGISVRVGAAPTLGLAWALARYGDRPKLGSVRTLPVAALNLDDESVGVLHRLGLRRVGQLLDMPRAGLALRLGEALLERLDETLGFRASATVLIPEPLQFYAQHRLAEPIALEQQVLRLCRWLADRLAERLERRGVGGRVFALDLFRVDGARKHLVVRSGRPLRDPARITALFVERLAVLNDGLEADFGFDLLRLSAEAVEPISLETSTFLGAADEGDFIALLDRLSTRLGPDAVHILTPAFDSRIPEKTVKSAPFTAKTTATWAQEVPARYDDVLLRPLTLFAPPQPIEVIAGVPEDPPERFSWRRLSHRVVSAEGPERIAWEWWLEEEASVDPAPINARAEPDDGRLSALPTPVRDRRFRDYYRVEDEQGRRFWVFREGAYAPGAAPRWFLHGLFP